MKTCSTCGETKPIADFNRREAAQGGHQSRCRDCTSDHWAKWKKENPEVRPHKLGDRVRRIKDQRLAEQGGKCGICKKSEVSAWHLDHDHSCCPDRVRAACDGGCLRGALCRNCNMRLVAAIESPYYEAALKYLAEWQERRAT